MERTVGSKTLITGSGQQHVDTDPVLYIELPIALPIVLPIGLQPSEPSTFRAFNLPNLQPSETSTFQRCTRNRMEVPEG